MEPQIQPKQGIGVELGRLQFQIISSQYYLDFLIINEKINTKPQKNKEMKRINYKNQAIETLISQVRNREGCDTIKKKKIKEALPSEKGFTCADYLKEFPISWRWQIS